MTHSLRILQYNVNKSRNKVLASLLEDPLTVTYNIIIIQEPWRNAFDSAAYNSRDSPFHLAALRDSKSRVCCYINKKFEIEA